MELRNYFQLEGQRRALDAYSRVVSRRDWATREFMEMYEASRIAFDITAPGDRALQTFTDKIYGPLKSRWYVFRSPKPGKCWSAQEVFETIKGEFPEFAWDGLVTLPNLVSNDKRGSLLPCLWQMKSIKPHSGYPIMTVSKFLHFYNPGLFPIYDTEEIWKRVVNGHFKRDFRDFCGPAYETGDTVSWLRNYIFFASDLVSSAHSGFMELFATWLGKQPGCSPEKWKLNASKLYATAFEFTVIGAAEAEDARLA